MSHVELPRPLENYFAHAELAGAQDGRRFTITLPYFNGERLDRLQWWWSLSHAQLRVGGEAGLAEARRAATLRFRQHIEYWLASNCFALRGDAPIPVLAVLDAPAATPPAIATAAEPAPQGGGPIEPLVAPA